MPRKIKLVIFDLDDTLTVGPTIWELMHYETDTWDSHGDLYWEQFKKGKFSYNEFIRKDVACWKGTPVSGVMRAIRKIKFVPRLKQTIAALKKRGIKTALISSSLEIFANYVSKKFGIDHVHANTLEVRRGKLTGNIRLNVAGNAKGRLTRRLKRRLGVLKAEVMAVGDGLNDLPMFREAGVNVTFTDASREIRKLADHVISKDDLVKILAFL